MKNFALCSLRFARFVLLFALCSLPASAQFTDRITRPCAAGATPRALVITNPGSNNNVEITTCATGSLLLNGAAVIAGGATINATNGVLPYRSSATAFSDSPLTRSSASLITSTAGFAFTLDNSLDIGVNNTSLRPRSGFFGTSLESPLFVARGATSGGLTIKAPAVAGTNTLTFPAGTTDFSATGGASQFVRQNTAGGAFTVIRPVCADLSDAGSGCTGGAGTTINATDMVMPYRLNATTFADSPLTRSSATLITSSASVAVPAGTVSAPSIAIGTNAGIWQRSAGVFSLELSSENMIEVQRSASNAASLNLGSTSAIGFTSGLVSSTGGDLSLSRNAANVLQIGNGTTNALGSILATNSTMAAYLTATNCADSAGAAACGSASAGSVVVDAGSTTVVVSTTAVTANSQIHVTFDSSLGARLGITCNTTAALPFVSARTAATSFTLSVTVAPAADAACYSYSIIN